MEAKTEKEKIPLGKLLIQKGFITEDQLLKALEVQRETGDKLGHTFIKLNFITEDQLTKVLEEQFGIPVVKINVKMFHPFVKKIIPEKICRKYRLIPILLEGETKLTIAASNPYDLAFIDEIKNITNYEIEIVLSTENSILEAINFCFGAKAIDWVDTENEGIATDIKVSGAKMLDMIFLQAYNMAAKEIQIQYFEKQFNVIFITPTTVVTSKQLPDNYFQAIYSRIKNLANLDEKNSGFTEGIFQKDIYNSKKLIRVLIFPTPQGENIVFKFS